MKHVTILRGQTARTYKPDRGFGYLPDAIDAFVERFRFVDFPEAKNVLPPNVNAAAPPAIFKHGKLDISGRTIVIDEVQVFQLGLLITAPTSTIDTDIIAETITEWAVQRFNLTLDPMRPSIHASSLEVEFEKPIPQLFPQLLALGEAIRNELGEFWESKPAYELVNLHFGFDPSKAGTIAPNPFKIERRAEMPFEKNLYYCEASLTTAAHIKVLELFERLATTPLLI